MFSFSEPCHVYVSRAICDCLQTKGGVVDDHIKGKASVREGLSPLPIERRNKLLSQGDSAQLGRTLQPSFTPNNLGSSFGFQNAPSAM